MSVNYKEIIIEWLPYLDFDWYTLHAPSPGLRAQYVNRNALRPTCIFEL